MSLRSFLRSLLAVLVFSPISLLAQGTITAQYFPSSVAPAGGSGTTGYPYAFLVKIQGWTACAGSQAYVKVYNSSNNEFMWTGGGWSNTTTYNASNQPVVSIDAGGNWTGWVYAKHNDALGTSCAVRAAKVGATSTNKTSASFSLNVLNLSAGGTGGWIIRPSSSTANKPIAAYSGGIVVGTYRSEDNGITEGYSYSAGGFKIAAPAGLIDSLVSYNDDGSRDQLFAGPWIITAGQETDASTAPATGGIGNVVVSPSILHGGQSSTLRTTVRSDQKSTLTVCSILLPTSWSWTKDTTAVRVMGPGSPAVAVHGDTISVSGAAVSGSDSMVVSIDCAPPDTTATFTLLTQTGAAADSLGLIGEQPTVFVYSTPLPIASAKENDQFGVPLRVNTMVTVRGIVTAANEFGSPSYIQDNSGGIAVYGAGFSQSVRPGDEVIVAGLLQPFNGLAEIVNPLLISTVGTGNSVTPTVVDIQQVTSDGVQGVEMYEGSLIRINRVTVTGSGAWTANSNYTIVDASGSGQLRIDDATGLAGRPIPAGAFDLVGVVGQYVTGSPFIGGYQIMPRGSTDIISSGPIIATLPVESDITSQGFTITWSTVNPGTAHLRFGTTSSFELGSLDNDSSTTTHAIAVGGLDPATVYYVLAFSTAGSDTSYGPTLVVSTASSSSATEAVNIYFNKSVNTALAWPTPANGNQDLLKHIIARIDSAHRSIDAALYSLSGNVGIAIRDALIRAKNRGLH
ncbi:MAG: DUF5689 domain-containing protein, partial [Bacteroidota bacterium]